MTAWKAHSGHMAWPTLALSLVLLTASVGVPLLVVAGLLPTWLGTVFMVGVCYGWFTPLHEAAHGNVGGHRSRQWLDMAVGWMASTAFLAPFPTFRAVHLRHHGTVNRPERDPDFWVSGNSVLEVVARCLTIIPHYYWMFCRQMVWESAPMRSAGVQALVAWLVFGGLVAVVSMLGHGALLFWLWVLPAWLASGLLAYAFDYLPHRPHDDQGRFTNARVLLGGPVLTWLTAGQNYHLVHHLWPRVPFYRYHTVFWHEREALVEAGAPVDHL